MTLSVDIAWLRQVCEQEAEGERIRKEKELERKIDEDFGNSRIGRLRSFCWNMTEYPETGRAAQVGEREPNVLSLRIITGLCADQGGSLNKQGNKYKLNHFLTKKSCIRNIFLLF